MWREMKMKNNNANDRSRSKCEGYIADYNKECDYGYTQETIEMVIKKILLEKHVEEDPEIIVALAGVVATVWEYDHELYFSSQARSGEQCKEIINRKKWEAIGGSSKWLMRRWRCSCFFPWYCKKNPHLTTGQTEDLLEKLLNKYFTKEELFRFNKEG